MITLEKDSNAEEVFIHATPEDLREFAKELWAISQKAETKGKHKEEMKASSGTGSWLSSKLQGEPRKHSIIKKLTISCRSE